MFLSKKYSNDTKHSEKLLCLTYCLWKYVQYKIDYRPT